MAHAALLGGLFIGVLSALPLVKYANCCCIWIVAGGFVAAYLNQQNDPRPMTPGRGALAGLLAGMVGSVVWLVVSLVMRAVFAPLQQRMAGVILRGTPDMPPEVRTLFESIGSNSALEFVLGFVVMLFVGSIASTIGGLLGAMFFRNDVPPALGGPPPLPPQ